MLTVEELKSSLRESCSGDDTSDLLEKLIDKVKEEVTSSYENVMSALKELLQPVSLMLRGDEEESTREDAMIKIKSLIRIVGECNATAASNSDINDSKGTVAFCNPLYDKNIITRESLSASEKTRCEIRELRALRGELEGEIYLLRQDLQTCNGERDSYKAQISTSINKMIKEISEIRKKCLDYNNEHHSDSDCTSEIDSSALAMRITELEKEISVLHKQSDRPTTTTTEISARSQYRDEKRLRIENTYSKLYKDDPLAMIYEVLRVAIEYKFMSPEDFLIKFANDFAECTPTTLLDKIQSRSGRPESIKDKYISECKQLSFKPNSGILRQLEEVGNGSSLIELNLSSNLIAESGLRPLLPLLQRMTKLQILNLSDNGIQNNSIQVLTEELRDHPSITSIDLSHNRISRSAGKDVISLIVANRRIKKVNLNGTRIDDALKKRIKDKIDELKINKPAEQAGQDD